ncbi:MAG: hypothetical protein HGA78_07395, partial [Nitrospirales bacterium]|nr:hypothetical protein [Nitrospirales bacterium]
MERIPHNNGVYLTAPRPISLCARISPSLSFYTKMGAIVSISGNQAKRGKYPTSRWAESSRKIFTA